MTYVDLEKEKRGKPSRKFMPLNAGVVWFPTVLFTESGADRKKSGCTSVFWVFSKLLVNGCKWNTQSSCTPVEAPEACSKYKFKLI